MATGTLKDATLEQRLDGWKAIARHISRSCRTVQRWYAEYGLPVRRLSGERSSVYAYRWELDEWMMNRGRGTKSPLANGTILPVSTPGNPSDLHSPPGDGLQISPPGHASSAALAAHAWKMWAILSTRNISEMALLFRQAIELDLGNASAFAGLSLVMIVEGVWGLVRAPQAYIAAHSALQWALEIDSELPAAKCAAAWLKMIEKRDWQDACSDFDRASKQQPPAPLTQVGRALLHIAAGSFQQASHLLLKAAQASPLSSTEVGWYCWSEYLAGKYANALHQIEQYRASGRTDPVTDAVEALVWIQLEEPDARIERLRMRVESNLQNDVLRAALGYAYAAAGRQSQATAILEALTLPKVHRMNHEPYAIVILLVGLKRRQEAVKWLMRAFREGSIWSLGFQHDPILCSLRNDPHFQMFLSKVNYPLFSTADSLQETSFESSH